MAKTFKTVHIIGSKTMGGAERFCFRLISALNDFGTECIAFVRKGSEVEKNLPDAVSYLGLPMRTVWDPLSMIQIKRAIKRISPSVVQTYMGRATRLTRLKKGQLPIHVSRLGGYYKLNGYRHAHAWIVNTKGLCDYLISNGFPKDKVFYVPNFVEEVDPKKIGSKEKVRKELGIPLDAWLLVTAGRFIPVKGHQYLIDAFLDLPDRIRNRPLYLAILGDGPLKGQYLEKIKGTGYEERIIFPGWVHKPERYYIASDMIVFPSLEMETLGNVILEAWAMKRPVVTSSFRGAREITEDKKDAIRVPCNDSNALKKAIQTLLDVDEMRVELALAGHAKVNSQFSKGVVLKRYYEIYEELTAQISRAGS